MSRPAMRLGVVMVLAALVACSDGSDGNERGGRGAPSERTGQTTTAPAAEPRPARYEPLADCPMPIPPEVTVTVECGELVVPENRLDPGSRDIRLAVARLRSRSPNPRPDPVVQLQGGPGFPSLENVASYARSAILDERDYIIWDQRGVGFSTPNLNCPETDEAIWAMFATTDPAVVEGERIEASLAACRQRLTGEGVDLDGYDTTQNAADLADLRVALGVDEWNLRGISYGSALAIETVRNHPVGLRSVLLDSVVPPDAPFGAVARGEGALRAFNELWAACAEDPSCASTYGDLEALTRQVATELDAEPYRSTITDPETGQPRPIAITGQDAYAGLFNALYDEALIPVMPSAIQSLGDGERGIIDALAAEGIPFALGQAEAMTASVNCADRGRLQEPEALEPFATAHPELAALLYLTVPETDCPRWDVEPAPESFNRLLGPDTDVPVLVMAGRFDPITPPDGSRRVAEALGEELLLFPNAGHGAVGSSDCARDIWFAFMDDPSTPPDTSCMATLGPPDFG